MIGELVGVNWIRPHSELQPRLLSQLRAQVPLPTHFSQELALLFHLHLSHLPRKVPSCFEEVGGENAEPWLQHSGHLLVE